MKELAVAAYIIGAVWLILTLFGCAPNVPDPCIHGHCTQWITL